MFITRKIVAWHVCFVVVRVIKMMVGFGIKRVLKKKRLGVEQAGKIRTKKERGEPMRSRHKLRRKLKYIEERRKEKEKKLCNLFVCPVAWKLWFFYGLIYVLLIRFTYLGFLIVELDESANKMRE